ncbi:hypothetical protein [Winogradskya humida]|uniref:Uncharacterized protein n=1 Tax=Winogradskya humida TaxID=113566 RepID=A0ABQ3ZZB3_9ACTN|nr:hypothetical protein [Actinoplanes humidus]GIE23708.1 hypothetical protein Ahu01nite_068100 [Actinoplanes humidus]
MTSTTELDRPITSPPAKSHGRRWLRRSLIAVAALTAAGVTTAATGATYVIAHSGNEPLPTGSMHAVNVYTVDDSISTTVPASERPGVIGRFIGMCDADTYYVEVDGGGYCVVLNGSLGEVEATGTDNGVELSPAEAAKVQGIVQRADEGGTEKTTRVVLEYDEGWAGMLKVADLASGGPVHGSAIN